MRLLIIGLVMSFACTITAQLPTTDLYMFSFLNNGNSITLRDASYLSNFNPDGYNNQPYFINPREVYITSNLYDKEYTDFIKLDLFSKEYYRVTATDSISEYSPTPKAPNRSFSAIRVEKDGKTQSLHLYPNDHKDAGKRVLPNIDNVGYHCWLSDNEVAMFLVGTPMKLAIGNIEDDRTTVVMENIGRCFRQDADGTLLFIHKLSADDWYIKSYDVDSNNARIITKTVSGSEDFEVLNDGTFIMAAGSNVYSYHPERDTDWQLIADLTEYDIKNITRIAASRNKIIFVNSPK